jgi:predicted Rossmann fold nucleotide-binding protein DprA/Smf involved in DNA uptake
MSTFPEVIYWLTLINESGLKLNLIKPIIQHWCLVDERQLSELFGMSPLELSTTFGLSDEPAHQILASAGQLEKQAAALARWQAGGLEPLILTDSRYPRRLAVSLDSTKQPLVLWTRGPVALLNRPGVTMLGRKNPDEATVNFIDELMSSLESEEIGLVSGYGRGLDRVTFEAILATEAGYATAILPMGLNAFAQTTTKLDDAVAAGRVVLVSPFSPDTPFDEKLADARNLIIDYQTMALLVPESDDDAVARASAALDRGVPVFVKANTSGNRALLDRGALLLTDPGEVVEWVQQATVDAALQETQDRADPEAMVAAPLAATAPSDPPLSDDDYSLRYEDVAPLDSDEAIEVLSLGGQIPEILRKRLRTSDDEEDSPNE